MFKPFLQAFALVSLLLTLLPTQGLHSTIADSLNLPSTSTKKYQQNLSHNNMSITQGMNSLNMSITMKSLSWSHCSIIFCLIFLQKLTQSLAFCFTRALKKILLEFQC
ncbi:hypothetical protein KP509_19G052600 [Ceratopteris richardii]|uniref:Uncharacterized protein n=1 Tax=Ceratopteris richardii TaxID=49495 RepID=A0A8T2SL60_CERRI|nr:hypothetical protein KP509_19G052600 [Ceratopteris richardii]